MADKKITELPVLTAPLTINDIFLAVQANVDYQLTGTQLAAFIASVLAVGSVVTFSNSIPANSVGNNSDVIIKPSNGEFWQKNAGVWALQYTTPAAGSGNTVLYGSGAPNNATGNNGDTYIDTDPGSGKFYKKTTGAWAQVFSMATGPAGPPGTGTNGTNGTNGNTILNGITPPSNGLGVNGDFYLDTNTYFIYGPKAGGVWGSYTPLGGGGAKKAYNYNVLDTRFTYDSVNYILKFTLNSSDQLIFTYDPINQPLQAVLKQKYTANKYKTRLSFEPTITDDGANNLYVEFEGVDTDLLPNVQIVLY